MNKEFTKLFYVDPDLLGNVEDWDVVFGEKKSYMIHRYSGEEHCFDTKIIPTQYLKQDKRSWDVFKIGEN